jgi:hypothetical protein
MRPTTPRALSPAHWAYWRERVRSNNTLGEPGILKQLIEALSFPSF